MSDPNGFVALEAELDRMAAVARDHGEKIEVAEMEAVVLATLAEIGALVLMADWSDSAERAMMLNLLPHASVMLCANGIDPHALAVNGAAIIRVGRLAEYNALAPDSDNVGDVTP